MLRASGQSAAAALSAAGSAADSYDDDAYDADLRRGLPEIARRIRVGMPHLDAGGLSENWLFRYAGDLHWEAISRRLGAASDQILGQEGERLYPTVVAVRARYDAPLAVARENQVLTAAAEVVPCGRACAHGRIGVALEARGSVTARLSLELLTTFARRQADGALRMALPAARLAARWSPVVGGDDTATIARLAKAARAGQPLDDPFCGPALDPRHPPLGRLSYEPSPYFDYNGAGLLYFASYATIADTAERRLVRQLGLADGRAGDWALATSPVARDVYYYANLPLGQSLIVELLDFAPASATSGGASPGPAGVKTRARLRRASDGQAIADVITRRAFVGQPS